MNNANAPITDLAKSLGPQTHIKCLLAAIGKCRTVRSKGSRSAIWKLPETTLTVFLMHVLIEHVSVEDAIELFPSQFAKLGLRDNRSVYSLVSKVSDQYATEVHRLMKKMVDGLADVPADGNATSLHLQLANRCQRVLISTINDDFRLTDIDSKQLNAMTGFIEATNGAIKVCADVTLTEAKVDKLVRDLKGTIDKTSKGGSVAPEDIAKVLHDYLTGNNKQAKEAAA